MSVFRDNKKSIKKMCKREANLLKRLNRLEERLRKIIPNVDDSVNSCRDNPFYFCISMDYLNRKSKIVEQLKEIANIKSKLGGVV